MLLVHSPAPGSTPKTSQSGEGAPSSNTRGAETRRASTAPPASRKPGPRSLSDSGSGCKDQGNPNGDPAVEGNLDVGEVVALLTKRVAQLEVLLKDQAELNANLNNQIKVLMGKDAEYVAVLQDINAQVEINLPTLIAKKTDTKAVENMVANSVQKEYLAIAVGKLAPKAEVDLLVKQQQQLMKRMLELQTQLVEASRGEEGPGGPPARSFAAVLQRGGQQRVPMAAREHEQRGGGYFDAEKAWRRQAVMLVGVSTVDVVNAQGVKQSIRVDGAQALEKLIRGVAREAGVAEGALLRDYVLTKPATPTEAGIARIQVPDQKIRAALFRAKRRLMAKYGGMFPGECLTPAERQARLQQKAVAKALHDDEDAFVRWTGGDLQVWDGGARWVKWSQGLQVPAEAKRSVNPQDPRARGAPSTAAAPTKAVAAATTATAASASAAASTPMVAAGGGTQEGVGGGGGEGAVLAAS